MRQLKPSRGLTLIELMVALAILVLLALAAAPYFSDCGVNSRLRESGNTLYGEALFAQSEAVKRNRVVQLATKGGVVTVSDITIPDNPVVLRTRRLADGVLSPNADVAFGSQGWPAALTPASFDLGYSGSVCSDSLRCPSLRIEAGGTIRLCGNHATGCS